MPDAEILVADPESAPQADVLVPTMNRIDSALMDRVRPRLILQFGVGLEGVDQEAASERGIEVGNIEAAGTGNADAAAEVAVFHLLSLSRRMEEAAAAVAAGHLGEPMGLSLVGLRVVILGTGAVGTAVARRLTSFGADIVAVNSGRSSCEGSAPTTSEVVPSWRLKEALHDAAVLIVCCSLNDSTRGLIGADKLSVMRDGALVVNVARGPILSYEALLAALRSGKVGGAGLDVFWDEPIDPADPLLEERVSLSPHIGGVSERSYRLIAERFADRVDQLGAVAPAS